MRALRQADPTWWRTGAFDGRQMRDILRRRDIGTVFRFLRARGWSRASIAAATGLTETRVREICQGQQRVTSYEVLERVADGFNIDRGLLGLGYIDDDETDEPRRTDRSRCGIPASMPISSVRLPLSRSARPRTIWDACYRRPLHPPMTCRWW
jgi:transcriptional regulator with XRE-family HTH domain